MVLPRRTGARAVMGVAGTKADMLAVGFSAAGDDGAGWAGVFFLGRWVRLGRRDRDDGGKWERAEI